MRSRRADGPRRASRRGAPAGQGDAGPDGCDSGRVPGLARHRGLGTTEAGRFLRRSPAPEESDLFRDGAGDHGPRYRLHHRGVQPDRRRPDPPAAIHLPGSSVPRRRHRNARSVRHTASQQPLGRLRRTSWRARLQHSGPGLAGARERHRGVGEFLPGAGRAPVAGPNLCRG